MAQHNPPERRGRPYKAVLFDVDGTLYRLRPLQRAVQFYFLRKNWHRPREIWKVHRAISAYRNAIDELRDQFAGVRDLKSAHLKLAARASRLPEDVVRACVGDWMETEPLAFLRKYRFAGLKELLAELRQQGLPLGVFSDFPAQEKLKALEVEEFFEVVLSAQDEEVQRFKPDPRGLEVVLRELGVEPQDAVYVGDRHSLDGVAAHRAGMDFLIAGDGHPGGVDTYWRLREILLPKKL